GKYINLCIIGDGIERKPLEQMVETLKLNKQISFVGSLYDEKLIADYIYNADICVSPGNVGLTAMHALVFGTPVITNDSFDYQMPEFEAIEVGVSGDFFQDSNADNLARKIELWIESQTDREKIRHQCIKKIDLFYNPNYQLKIIKNVIEANN